MPTPSAYHSNPPVRTTSWPITVGAEGIAAAQFARCGFDVLVQAGRDKPWYDLAVTRAGNLLKVSVKASEDGCWFLAQGFARSLPNHGSKVDCRSAIDLWVDSQGSKTICCLVQFDGVPLSQLPRIYLAFPYEIAGAMRTTAERTGHCTLFEQYEWRTSIGEREFTALPSSWRFSEDRIQDLLERQAAGMVPSSSSGRVGNGAAPGAGRGKVKEFVLSA